MANLNVNASDSLNVAGGFVLSNNADPNPVPSNTVKLVESDLEKLKKLYPKLDEKRAAELLAKYPNLMTLLPEERDKIINGQQLAVKQTDKKNKIEKNTDFSNTAGVNFDFEGYANKDLKGKAKSLLEEYAKNRYQNEWDTFSDEKKAGLIKECANKLIQKYNKTDEKADIEKIIKEAQNPKNASNISDRDKKRINQRMLSLMADIQTANKEEISISDFYNVQDKEQRNAQKFELISELVENGKNIDSVLSNSDKSFYENEKLVVEAAREILEDNEISSGDITKKIAEYNKKVSPDKRISRASLVYDYLDKKPENELSETDKKIYNSYKYLKNNGIDLSKVKDFDSSNSTFVKMYESEVYQKALLQNKGKKDAEKNAMIAYLNSQLKSGKGKALSREEFNKKFDELLSGCSMQGAQELMHVAAEMKKRNFIVFKSQNLVVNEQAVVAAGAETDIDDFNVAVKQGSISEDNVPMFATFLENANYGRIARNPKDAEGIENIKKLRRQHAHHIDLKQTTQAAKEAGVSDEILYNIANDVNIEYDSYTTEARCAIYKNGGHITPEKYQAQFINGISSNIKQHGDTEGYLAMSSSASTYSGKNQLKAGEAVMSMESYFDKETNLKAQRALTDDIPNCEVENQTAMHKLVSSSSYSETQKYAAENIYKLDESVQADAIKITYATGNADAIEACNSQLSLCKGDLSAAQAEIKTQQAVLDGKYIQNSANAIADGYTLIQKTLGNMSSTELKQYYEQKQKEFINANANERYNMISGLPESLKKEAYLFLAKSRSSLLSAGMIKDIVQMGYASQLLNDPSVASNVKFELVHQMFESGNSNKKTAAKFVMSNEAIFAPETVKTAETILNNNNIEVKEITKNG